MKYLLECESHLKSIIAYEYSKEYELKTPFAYLKTENYSQDTNLLSLSKTISSFVNTINNYKEKKGNAINHYISNHHDVPLWVLFNYVTFGQVVHFYSHIDDKIKNQIAKEASNYGKRNGLINIYIEPKDLENILFNLFDLRNCVAHNNLIFKHTSRNNIKYYPQMYEAYHIGKTEPRNSVFSDILSMQLLLDKGQYDILYNTIIKRTFNLHKKIKTVPSNCITDQLGFPKDFQNFPKRYQEQ